MQCKGSTGKIVADGSCSRATKPVSSQQCNTQKCPFCQWSSTASPDVTVGGAWNTAITDNSITCSTGLALNWLYVDCPIEVNTEGVKVGAACSEQHTYGVIGLLPTAPIKLLSFQVGGCVAAGTVLSFWDVESFVWRDVALAEGCEPTWYPIDLPVKPVNVGGAYLLVRGGNDVRIQAFTAVPI